MKLLEELNRRNVIRVAILYGAIAWLLIQVTDVLSSALNLPHWTGALVLTLLALGFLPVLVFSWVYELTPEGLKREQDVDRSASTTQQTARKLNVMIVALLVIAISSVWLGRFLSSDTVATDTPQETQEASPANNIETIAVLPFVNMSDDPGNEFFADGVSEEILNLLARAPELRVTSRSSAFSFKEQNVDIPTIAERLNVGHVLEGSVRKSGNQLRITAQLIEVKTDAHLWSETYDRELDDIFAVQDEIAAAVVKELRVQLLGEIPKGEQTEPEAYSLYLQARQLLNNRSEENLELAETLLTQALDIDSDFAPAWVALAVVYNEQTSYYGSLTIGEGRELGRNAVDRALEADPDYGPALAEQAMIELDYEFDFAAARRYAEDALALNSSDARTLQVASWLELSAGNLDEAISLGQRAVAVDPLSHWSHNLLGWIYYRAGRMEDAENSYRDAMSLLPEGSDEPGWIIAARAYVGDFDSALQLAEAKGGAILLLWTAVLQPLLDNPTESRGALDELMEKHSEQWTYQIAVAHTLLDDFDAAFDWLDRALEIKDPILIFVRTDPFLAKLHSDPRWGVLLDDIGLPR